VRLHTLRGCGIGRDHDKKLKWSFDRRDQSRSHAGDLSSAYPSRRVEEVASGQRGCSQLLTISRKGRKNSEEPAFPASPATIGGEVYVRRAGVSKGWPYRYTVKHHLDLRPSRNNVGHVGAALQAGSMPRAVSGRFPQQIIGYTDAIIRLCWFCNAFNFCVMVCYWRLFPPPRLLSGQSHGTIQRSAISSVTIRRCFATSLSTR